VLERIFTVVLWLFVVNLGIAFGAGLYESRIVAPQWLNAVPGSEARWNAAAARDADVGLRFWVYVTTVPLTLLTIASLVAAWWTPQQIRLWWLVACTATLAERIMTFTYFIPTMLTLMREGALSELAAASKARQWMTLGYVRHAATLIAWLAALKALSLLGTIGG
jgi:hypothetical protein